MHVTALHHIGLLLLLNLYAYITDKRAFRQTKLAALVLALARYDTGTKRHMISYTVSNTSDKNYCNRIVYVKIIIIIIIIINNNIYGAVLVTMVTARVHPVHLMNADRAPGGRQPSHQANRLGL